MKKALRISLVTISAIILLVPTIPFIFGGLEGGLNSNGFIIRALSVERPPKPEIKYGEFPLDSPVESLPNLSENRDASDGVGSGRIYDSWDDFPYNNMLCVDEEAFEYLKKALDKVDYYGEFKTGNTDANDFYIEKYSQLISNEVPFIDTETGKEVFLNQFETLAGCMEDSEAATHHLKNKTFYYFDVDEDDAPELCISSEYIFKYIPELGKCILWGGYKGNPYYSMTGSRKMTWDHGLASEILHTFYQMYKSGKEEYTVFFFIRQSPNPETGQAEITYMVTLPRYACIDERLMLPKEIEGQAYSFYADYINQDEIVYCFRATEEQYNELTRDYFIARELAKDKIKEVTFTYDELFDSDR